MEGGGAWMEGYSVGASLPFVSLTSLYLFGGCRTRSPAASLRIHPRDGQPMRPTLQPFCGRNATAWTYRLITRTLRPRAHGGPRFSHARRALDFAELAREVHVRTYVGRGR